MLKRLDNDIENVTSIIIACFILHNILQINDDNYEDVNNYEETYISLFQQNIPMKKVHKVSNITKKLVYVYTNMCL